MRKFIACLAFFALLSSAFAESSFLVDLGKNTPRWRYVKEEKDWREIRWFQNLYEQNIDRLSEKGEYRIPKIVHVIWGGPKNFPIESVHNIRTWMALHPDWTFKFWTDRARPAPCEGMEVHLLQDFSFQFLSHQMENLSTWGQFSDMWRFEILYKEGGVYIDHDANCLKAFDALHKSYDFYGCLEMPHWGIDGYHITAGAGLFGAKPSHPVVHTAMMKVKENWDRIHKKYANHGARKTYKIGMNTGYIAFTHALHESLGKDNNIDIVLPPTYFFAAEGLPSLYSHHFYWNAWDDGFEVITPKQKEIDSLMHKLRKKQQGMLYLFSLSGVMLILSLVFLKRART